MNLKKYPLKNIPKRATVEWLKKYFAPVVLREQGRGFAMKTWKWNGIPGQNMMFDCVVRTVPSCGTVACLGGTVQMVTGLLNRSQMTDFLGLRHSELEDLFYGWNVSSGPWEGFAEQYWNAKTPLAKARIALKVLYRAVESGAARGD